MPGVTVTTSTRTGPTGPQGPPEGRYFVPGITERGPVGVAVPVNSLAQYVTAFGGRVAYGRVYDDLRCFFEEGGVAAYVTRLVGGDAEVATATSVDRAGTPVATIRWDAINPGAWGADLDVVVAAGTASGAKITVLHRGEMVERYDNLATVAAIVAAVNAGSDWITATDLASATAAPNNLPKIETKNLAGGDDDRAALVAADTITALALFGPELGAGAVGLPELTSPTDIEDIAAHGVTHRRLMLICGEVDDDQAEASDAVFDLLDEGHGEEVVGFFWPWVTIDDAGTTLTVPPTGYVAGVRARTIAQVGEWRPPAGQIAQARFVTGVAAEVTRAEADALYEDGVNPIRTIAGTTRLYGWRSLSTDVANWALLSYADVVHVLQQDGENLLEPYVFDTIDSSGQLLGRIAGAVLGLAAAKADANGLFARFDANGDQIDPGYRVDVDSVNTPETFAANEVHVVLAVRPSPAGTLITLEIVKASLTATL